MWYVPRFRLYAVRKRFLEKLGRQQSCIFRLQSTQPSVLTLSLNCAESDIKDEFRIDRCHYLIISIYVFLRRSRKKNKYRWFKVEGFGDG